MGSVISAFLRVMSSLGTGEVTEKHAVSWQRILRVQVIMLNKILVQLYVNYHHIIQSLGQKAWLL